MAMLSIELGLVMSESRQPLSFLFLGMEQATKSLKMTETLLVLLSISYSLALYNRNNENS